MKLLKEILFNKKKLEVDSVVFIGIVVLLSVIGLSEMLSAYSPAVGGDLFSPLKLSDKFCNQLFFYIIGFGLCVFISDLRLRAIGNCPGKYIIGLGFFVLFLQLLTKAGPAINGSHRWLPVISLQPSELIPIYGVLAIAWIKSLLDQDVKKWNIAVVYIIIVLLCFTVYYPQDNLSTAAVYFLGFVLISVDLYFKKYFKWIVCAVAIGIALVLSVSMFYGSKYRAESGYPCSGFRCKRLVNWAMYDLNNKLPVEEDWKPGDSIKYKYQDKFQKYIDADGSQPLYAKTAIIKGGMKGYGFNLNEVNNRNRIAISYADYIFAVLAAEHGFIITFLVLIGIAFVILLLLTNIINKANDKDNFDPFLLNLSKGVIIMLSLQCLVHIWVNLSLMPVTGIPLPLFSHGGSSLLSTFAMLGILLNMTKIPVK